MNIWTIKWCNIDSLIKCIHLQKEKWRKNLQIKTRLPRPTSFSWLQYLKMTCTLLRNLSIPIYIIAMNIRRRYKWEEKDYPLKSDVDAGRILHPLSIFTNVHFLFNYRHVSTLSLQKDFTRHARLLDSF